MQMDLNLNTKQAFWESSRSTAILVAAVAGTLGFKIGQAPPSPAPIVIQLQQPASR